MDLELPGSEVMPFRIAGVVRHRGIADEEDDVRTYDDLGRHIQPLEQTLDQAYQRSGWSLGDPERTYSLYYVQGNANGLKGDEEGGSQE